MNLLQSVHGVDPQVLQNFCENDYINRIISIWERLTLNVAFLYRQVGIRIGFCVAVWIDIYPFNIVAVSVKSFRDMAVIQPELHNSHIAVAARRYFGDSLFYTLFVMHRPPSLDGS